MELLHKHLSQAIDAAGLSAPELAMNLDRLRTLVQRVLLADPHETDTEVDAILKSEVERLGSMLNPIFRPEADGDLPFASSFTGVRIGYWADARGFVVSALDWVGRPILRAYARDALMNPLAGREPWQFSEPELKQAPLDLAEIKEKAIAAAKALVTLWDHPVKEPYFAEHADLEAKLTALLQDREALELSLAYGDFPG
jgi:hypothetical protein